MKRVQRWICIVTAMAAMLAVSACKSYWIDATVENRTGQPIRELEVGYPTASFGTNNLAPEASFRYRLQTRGSGPVKVEYMSPDGKIWRNEGLTLIDHQQGELTIRLLPEGKADFLPSLHPAS